MRTSSEYDRGSYHLFDTSQNSLKTLVSWLAEAKPSVQTIVDPISFASFDGEQVSGYMSHPDKQQAMPLVVYVHGGPHGVRDYWRFDPTIQILGAHGFRVLQVNYRGSGGYGHRFKRIGYRKWGSDIQQDIISGVEWAIEQGHASADNICIIGGSFGAYSALQSSILRPDLFKCTVGTAGVYDLPLMHKEGDIPEQVFGDDYLNDAVGNDMAELTRFSPVHNVDKLQSNVLIVHGTKDRRTPIEQANSLISAFNEAGFKHQYVELEGEGHGIFNDESREQHYRRLVQFLSDNLN